MDEVMISMPPEANIKLPDPSLLQHYRDSANRVIWVTGEIDSYTDTWVAQILNYNREDAGKASEDRKPIKMYIKSPGGSLEDAKMLVSVMELSKTPIWTIGLSTCASAASVIYLAGHKKLAVPSAYFVFHKGGIENLSGSYTEIVNFVADYEEKIAQLEEYYIAKTKFTPEEVQKGLEQDWYIHIDEALERGIVDKVVENVEDLL